MSTQYNSNSVEIGHITENKFGERYNMQWTVSVNLPHQKSKFNIEGNFSVK